MKGGIEMLATTSKVIACIVNGHLQIEPIQLSRCHRVRVDVTPEFEVKNTSTEIINIIISSNKVIIPSLRKEIQCTNEVLYVENNSNSLVFYIRASNVKDAIGKAMTCVKTDYDKESQAFRNTKSNSHAITANKLVRLYNGLQLQYKGVNA